MTAEAIPSEVLSFEKIKQLYPNEWVLIGNPDMEQIFVRSGIVLMHGKDIREIAYTGRELAKKYKTFTLKWTGEFPKNRKFWLDFRRVKST